MSAPLPAGSVPIDHATRSHSPLPRLLWEAKPIVQSLSLDDISNDAQIRDV
jgi:hypothetical protein